MYNTDYYGDYDKKKPTFEYDEEIDGDYENYDEFDANEQDYIDDKDKAGRSGVDTQKQAEKGVEEGDEGELTYYSGASLSRRRKRGRKKKFTEGLLRKKPKFDPSKHKDFEHYFDEYYALDFEDVIGGDVKCKFKYKTVEPNDFGLSTEEVFMADDGELNRFYSLKKLLRNDRNEAQEVKERKVFGKRARDDKFMRNMFPSLYEDVIDEDSELDEDEARNKEEEKKKKKNLKKKLRREKRLAQESHSESSQTVKKAKLTHD